MSLCGANKWEAGINFKAVAAAEEAEPVQSAAARHQYLFLEFALTLVQRGLKKGSLGGSSPHMLAMLDPLLPHLVTCLSSRHSAVVELSLRIFSRLVQLPLSGELLQFYLLLALS